MNEKEKEIFFFSLLVLLLFSSIVLLVAPNHGMTAPAAAGSAELERSSVDLVVLAPELEPSPEAAAVPALDYILNTNTKRFHYPDCKSVLDIHPENVEPVTATRDELIARGYTPCGNCRP